MAEQHSQIHFVNGETIDVAGTLGEVQGRLNANRGAAVKMEAITGGDVLVSPQHVVFVEAMSSAPLGVRA